MEGLYCLGSVKVKVTGVGNLVLSKYLEIVFIIFCKFLNLITSLKIEAKIEATKVTGITTDFETNTPAL